MNRIWQPHEVLALGVRTDLETAASVLGFGRTRAFELARAGKFPVPVLRIGVKYVVPVAGLRDLLGISLPAPVVGPASPRSDSR